MKKRLVAMLVALAAAGGAACGEEATPAPPMVPSPMPEPPQAPALAPAATAPETPAPVHPVMAEAQKKWVLDLEAALTARDAKRFAALYSTGAVVTTAGKDGVHDSIGRAEIERNRERGFSVMGKAFPDVKWAHSRALQKGSVLVLEFVGLGTDTGGFMDDKPTNKKVGWRGVSILWFDDDGLVKREHAILDPLTILGQLGKGEAKAKVRAPLTALPPATSWITASDSPDETKNLDTAKNLYALLDKKDDKGFVDLLTDDAVHADLAQPDDVKGKDATKRELAAWFKAFPDSKTEVTHAWAFGDVVVAELAFTGTFKGPLGPLKPNNKSGTTHGIDVVELKSGKVARVTSYTNAREFLFAYDLQPPAPTTTTTAPKP